MTRLPGILANGRGAGIAAVAAIAVGQAAAAGVAAFATREAFAALRAPGAAPPAAALALIALSGIAIACLRVAEQVIAERVGQDYACELRLRLFRRLSRLPARILAEQRTGGLALRFVGDLTAVRNWVSLGVARMISAAIVLPAATAVLFALDPLLGLAAAAPIALGLGLMALSAPRLGRAHRRLRARRAGLAADMSERIPHAPELRLMGRMSIERRALLRRTRRMVRAAIRRRRGAAYLRAIPDAVSGVAAAALILAALRSGAGVATTAGALAAVGLMIQPLRNLAGVWDRHRAWVAARDKCIELLEKPKVKRPGRPKARLSDDPQPLRFAHVASAGLTDIDIAAQAGRKIAVIGPNGAGKSTLLALAAGLDAPTRGKVRIGDHAPASLSASERRRLVSYVGARTPILAGSLRRALTMGAGGRRDDADILLAARGYGLGEVIERLGGLDGHVAEAGRNLSAGEVRRAMLTRAALSDARLLLLDEPDDALDSVGPELVTRLLRGSPATALVVTHNPIIARQMDEIWFIADGTVIEAASPEAMFAEDGVARAFFAPSWVA